MLICLRAFLRLLRDRPYGVVHDQDRPNHARCASAQIDQPSLLKLICTRPLDQITPCRQESSLVVMPQTRKPDNHLLSSSGSAEPRPMLRITATAYRPKSQNRRVCLASQNRGVTQSDLRAGYGVSQEPRTSGKLDSDCSYSAPHASSLRLHGSSLSCRSHSNTARLVSFASLRSFLVALNLLLTGMRLVTIDPCETIRANQIVHRYLLTPLLNALAVPREFYCLILKCYRS